MAGLIFSGTWECEGHIISFNVLANNRVKVVESIEKDNPKEIKSFSKRMSIDEAVLVQEKYISLGYTRIS